MKREVSRNHEELYLRDDVLLDAALKTDSGTRAMSGVTDLLLNLQCSERSASAHKHSKIQCRTCLLYSYMLNVLCQKISVKNVRDFLNV